MNRFDGGLYSRGWLIVVVIVDRLDPHFASGREGLAVEGVRHNLRMVSVGRRSTTLEQCNAPVSIRVHPCPSQDRDGVPHSQPTH